MPNIAPYQRPSLQTTAGDHEKRLRALERRPPGTWVYVGTFPGDFRTTIDSPPFENGILGNPYLRFRRTNENETAIQGNVLIPDGEDVAGLVVFTVDDPIYIPDEDVHDNGIVNGLPCDWLLTTYGQFIFNGYLCCATVELVDGGSP